MEDELDQLEERRERTADVCESMQAKLDELVQLLHVMVSKPSVPSKGVEVMKAWCEPPGEGMNALERDLMQLEVLFGVSHEQLEEVLDPDPKQDTTTEKPEVHGDKDEAEPLSEGDGAGPEVARLDENENDVARGETSSISGGKQEFPSLRDPPQSGEKHGMSVAFADESCPPKEQAL